MSEDWFEQAGKDAEAKSPRRNPNYGPGPVVHGVDAPPKSLAEINEAKKVFSAVSSGRAPMVGTGPSPVPGTLPPFGSKAFGSNPNIKRGTGPQDRRVTAAQGLEAILREISASDDPFKAAGEWITKVTNGITEITRELDSES